nr:MAG: hypothetical protein DIU80_23235 [Chloroflexota bacterium]
MHSESALCILDNVRELRDGSGLATVRIVPLATSGARKRGTWLLHFADHSMLKRHLKGRVDPARQGMLDGVRRRHRRK